MTESLDIPLAIRITFATLFMPLVYVCLVDWFWPDGMGYAEKSLPPNELYEFHIMPLLEVLLHFIHVHGYVMPTAMERTSVHEANSPL